MHDNEGYIYMFT